MSVFCLFGVYIPFIVRLLGLIHSCNVLSQVCVKGVTTLGYNSLPLSNGSSSLGIRGYNLLTPYALHTAQV